VNVAQIGDELWNAVLGPFPDDPFPFRQTEDNVFYDPGRPQAWPTADGGPHNGTFWFRAMAARIIARGTTMETAKAERLALMRGLQTGGLTAVAVHPETGRMYEIRPEAWHATGDTGRTRWWTGVSWIGAEQGVPCDVYLIDAEPRADWCPTEKQIMKTWAALDGLAECAARVRLKAAGASTSEKAICGELSAMWREAGRTGGSKGSIEATRFKLRHG
jgi:hypothetical protein